MCSLPKSDKCQKWVVNVYCVVLAKIWKMAKKLKMEGIKNYSRVNNFYKQLVIKKMFPINSKC